MTIGGATQRNAHVSSFHTFAFLVFLPFFSSYLTCFPPVTTAASESVAVGGSWRNGGENTVSCNDGSTVSPILVTNWSQESGRAFACGFFCDVGCMFSVFLVYYNGSMISNTTKPQVVWSANRDKPIKDGNAMLKLSAGGELQLLNEPHGVPVWSSDTYNRGVVSMNLTEKGNLKLVDDKNNKVWQSYDYPTDTAVVGQDIRRTKLTSNMSPTNSTFSFSFTSSSFKAYIYGPDSPDQMYYNRSGIQDKGGVWLPHSMNGSDTKVGPNGVIGVRSTSYTNYTMRFIRLEADGHLQQYKWQEDSYQWEIYDDDMLNYKGKCSYPTQCGKYGVCSEGAHCSCPLNDPHFKPVDPVNFEEGCENVKPCSCGQPSQLIPYNDTAYFAYIQEADIPNTDVEKCKAACLSNCSCQAAFFKYRGEISDVRGDCYLRSTIYSLIRINVTVTNYSSTAFIKVLNYETSGSSRRLQRRLLAVKISIPVICFLLLLCGFVFYKKRCMLHQGANGYQLEGDKADNDTELFKFDHLPGMPTRFSFDELKIATNGFSRKVGEGGFGAVFQGTLRDGTQVAVKILGYRGQGMKEFLAEVVTIGSIHHHNLVRLVGYCAERLHRLLVYEYLSNGSLEKWIFHDEKDCGGDSKLDFRTKKKIILDVARGLSYLHEDCRNKIIHLDIKPQNILLDTGFNAKVSDFGLSKLIDREQTEVVTTLRGTPGYLAPEWLNSAITEKVDVYSFGVVVLEMVSGKRILDYSRSRGSSYLVGELVKATEEGRLQDMIGVKNVDEEEALKLVKIATWCLQEDFTKRPSMSTVVKVLEGLVDMVPMLEGLWVSSSTPTLSAVYSDCGGSSASMAAPLSMSNIAEPR